MKKTMRHTLSCLLALALIISLIGVIPVFAAYADMTFDLPDVTVALDGTNNGTAKVSVFSRSADTLYNFEGVYSLTETNGTNHLTLSAMGSEFVSLTGMDVPQLSTGKVMWSDRDFSQNKQLATGTELVWAEYTVDKDTPAGEYNVTFRMDVYTGATADSDLPKEVFTAKVKVTRPVAPVPVTSVKLDKDTLDLTTGSSATLTATVEPDDATNKNVTWESSDSRVATVDENGKVTAVGAGDATITATAGGKSASCKVTVSTKTPEPVLITGITLKDTSMKVGDKKTLTAVIEPTDATNQALRWSIVNSEIASIDETTGVVTALKEGTTTVTVKATDGSGVSATCKVTVTKKDSTIVTPGDDTGAGVIAGGAIIGALGNGSLPFNDVTARDYFYDAVKWAVDRGITSGTSRYTFSPDAPCTRAQVVTFLWRAAGCPQPVSKVNPFTDVRADDYFYTAVLWAVENGITNGTSAKTFSPDATVTRAQVVTFLWRANGQPAAGNSGFLDVSSNAYYARAVDWAFTNGITTGMDYGAFGPDTACTRAQIVTFLYRAR